MTLGQDSAGRNLKARLGYLGFAMIAGLLLLAAQLYRLQIAQGEEYAARSVDNFVTKIRVHADRGMIMDRAGQILVDNRPSTSAGTPISSCTPRRCSRAEGWRRTSSRR